MAEQYWLGGFFIDLSRNQITHNNETITLPPKVLAVLTYLAEHQGKVVSQDDLLDNIWKGTIVSPNTLQRCIAQLRKALGDDSKQQQFIKTHAKKGYSLECSVSWQNVAVTQHQEKTDNADKKDKADQADLNSLTSESVDGRAQKNTSGLIEDNPKNKILWPGVAAGIVVLGLLVIGFFITEPPLHFSIDNIQPQTSTDNRELASIYSPDGKYIVFKRYPEVLCVNNLWAKNIETQEEFQLTNTIGAYDRPAFSPDGKTLAFVKEVDCRTPITQTSCFELQSLDFAQALRSPQTPNTLMECKNTEIRTANWLDNEHISLLQNQDERWRLISYSISENRSKTLYERDSGNLIAYDVSLNSNLLALSSVDTDGRAIIEMLKPDGELISSNRIQFPESIPKFRPVSPRFSPITDLLLFSTGRQLFSLSYEGEVERISVPLDEAMGTPVFHPDGKRMLAIKGYYDSDVVMLPLQRLGDENTELSTESLSRSTLARSTLGEDYAKFQPGGEWIAYMSNRSGTAQIWLTDGTINKQLSQFPLDTFITSFIWAKDGQSLLVSAAYELKRIALDGSEMEVNYAHPVSQLFYWDSQQQSVLAAAKVEGLRQFVEIDLARGNARIINNKKVVWAQKTSNGELIYLDRLDRFWRPGPAEEQLIPIVDGQGSHKHFMLHNDVIYGINRDFQLWSFALTDNTFTVLAQLPDTVDYITDINDEQMLLTLRIAARKEVVELTLL